MKYFYMIILIASGLYSSASTVDSTKTEAEPLLSLTLAAIYSSNVNYYGQTAAEKLPYALSNASLRFRNGIYLSASAYKLFNYGSGISAADLGAGYQLSITKNLTGTVGYSRSFYPANSPLLQAANENNLSGSLAYDWNWINTSLSADYAFGESEDIFTSFSNSKLISLGSIFKDKDIITMEPGVDVIAGTREFYKTYINKKNIKDKLLEKFPGKALPPGLSKADTTTFPYNRFSLLSYNIKLPLAYSRTHYTFEAAYMVSVLNNKKEKLLNRAQSFFNLSFYYLF